MSGQNTWGDDANARAIPAVPAQRRAELPSQIDTAVSIAQEMLAEYGDPTGYDQFAYAQAYGGLREALRILLRAVDAERGESR